VSEHVNRKCLLGTRRYPYTDSEPSNFPLPHKKFQRSIKKTAYVTWRIHYVHVTHMQITWYCLYTIFVDQHLQRSTVGYLSNSSSSIVFFSGGILSCY